MRVKKEDGKGTSFADLVWKPVVLIEIHKRGRTLSGVVLPGRRRKLSEIYFRQESVLVPMEEERSTFVNPSGRDILKVAITAASSVWRPQEVWARDKRPGHNG